MKLSCIALRATYSVEDIVELPDYTGSTFRGALAGGLKAIGCKKAARRTCHQQCGAPSECSYGLLFETPMPERALRRISGSTYAPHPWVIDPPEGGVFFAGDQIELDVTLFGSARRHIRDLAGALVHFGSSGVGKDRGKLILDELTDRHSGAPVLRDEEFIPRNIRSFALSLDALGSEQGVGAVKITFRTPVQLLNQGKLRRDLTAVDFIQACASRVQIIANVYGSGDDALRPRVWAERARDANLTIKHSNLTTVRLDRWSSRQQRKHELAGLTGSFVIRGDLDPFMGLLGAAAITHIGKGVAFGLGAFDVQPL